MVAPRAGVPPAFGICKRRSKAPHGLPRSSRQRPDGVIDLNALTADVQNGCRVFVHYNGPTDQLTGMCTGMVVLDPGASPPPPHRQPEEEFMIVAEGTGEIERAGKTTQVGPGSI